MHKHLKYIFCCSLSRHLVYQVYWNLYTFTSADINVSKYDLCMYWSLEILNFWGIELFSKWTLQILNSIDSDLCRYLSLWILNSADIEHCCVDVKLCIFWKPHAELCNFTSFLTCQACADCEFGPLLIKTIFSQERNSVQLYYTLIPLTPQQARACSCLLHKVRHDCRLYVSHY